MEKIRLGVSSCFLGEKVRYDGGHKLDPYLTDALGRYFEWVPACPELEYGLSVPREPMRLVGSPDAPGSLQPEAESIVPPACAHGQRGGCWGYA